jgi:hypothetical protein
MGLMTNVQRRGSVYYYRRRVPLDLQAVIGRAVIKESLNERDPTRARQVHAQRAAWWEERFALLRRRMSAETAPLRRDLSPEEIQSLADGYRHMFLNADEQIRLRGLGGSRRAYRTTNSNGTAAVAWRVAMDVATRALPPSRPLLGVPSRRIRASPSARAR